ncbi:MAG: hypothetical protein IJR77_06545 [Bacteroidales bacterium]|nr:hypothetical protein [Bacteroidales bacterium]
MKQCLSVFAVTVLLLFCGCGPTKKVLSTNYQVFSIEKMVKNYEDNKDGIADALAFTADALNDHCGIQLVLDQTGVSQFFVYNFMWLGTNNPQQKDFDILMPLVGLTQDELDTVISKLRSVNCLSAELMKSGSQFAKVLFWENKECGYYYHIYYDALSDAELAENTKTMEYCIPYSNKMFLEYNPKKDNADATFPEREQYMKELNLPRNE